MNFITEKLGLITDWIRAVDFGDEVANRTSIFLQSTLLLFLTGIALIGINYLFTGSYDYARPMLVTLLASSFILWLIRQKHLQAAILVFTVGLVIVTTFELFQRNGVRGIGVIMYPVGIIIVSLITSSRRVFVLYSFSTILAVGLLIWGEEHGWIQKILLDPPSIALFGTYTAMLAMIAVIVRIMTETLFSSLARGRKNEQDATQRANELRALYEASLDINAQSDVTALLQSTAKQAAKLLGMQRGSIYLLRPDQTLELVIQFNIPSSYRGVRLKLGEGVAGRVVESGKPLMIADYRNWEHRAKVFDAMPSRRVIGVPLRTRNRMIGSLNVTDSEQVGLFSEDQVRLLQLFADQSAIAIENAQLFDDAQKEIQERRRIETERESLIQELETKNAELEQFTYTVSHDLKSPLITIRGFLGLLEQDALSGKTELLKSDVLRITNATDRMQQLLNELLELSRIGRLMNPPEAWHFESIAHEAVSLVEGRIAKQGIQVSIQFGMPQIYGDHVRLVEAVQNLVDNASKFMGDQPKPQIEIGCRGNAADGKPIFFVRDNGAGIDPKYHERIFGLFNKLDAQSEGTGIGLALVKRIIEVHGGKIWVESEGQGKGTAFCFTLPIPSPAVNGAN